MAEDKKDLTNIAPANVGADDNDIYQSIRSIIVDAQHKVYKAVNFTMVVAYWNIGKLIYEASGQQKRAEYGKELLKYLSKQLTAEFGKGFNERNLQLMRKFFLTFVNPNTLCTELSWSHYRLLMSNTHCLRIIHRFMQPSICHICQVRKNCARSLTWMSFISWSKEAYLYA